MFSILIFTLLKADKVINLTKRNTVDPPAFADTDVVTQTRFIMPVSAATFAAGEKGGGFRQAVARAAELPASKVRCAHVEAEK